MNQEHPTPITGIDGWHAHIYYDPATTRATAERLREWIASAFEVTLGRWHDVKVGPHPQAMFQIAFGNAAFPQLVPFLAMNRMGLTILVHPNTENEYLDHLVHSMWMGQVLLLDGSMLRKGPEL